AAYPAAELYGAPGVAGKRRDLQFHGVLGDEAPLRWRGELAQHHVRGAPIPEGGVFLHPASRPLILTDLAFNVPAGRTAGARLFYLLTGAAGRFGPHRMGRLMIRDRRAARAPRDTI